MSQLGRVTFTGGLTGMVDGTDTTICCGDEIKGNDRRNSTDRFVSKSPYMQRLVREVLRNVERGVTIEILLNSSFMGVT